MQLAQNRKSRIDMPKPIYQIRSLCSPTPTQKTPARLDLP